MNLPIIFLNSLIRNFSEKKKKVYYFNFWYRGKKENELNLFRWLSGYVRISQEKNKFVSSSLLDRFHSVDLA